MAKTLQEQIDELVKKGKIQEAVDLAAAEQIITPEQARDMIIGLRASNSKEFFVVEFIKRTNGEYRIMNCQFGVTKDLKGGEPAYDFNKHDLVCVHEVRGSYRSIPLDAIRRVKIHGQAYTVKTKQS